MKHKSLNILSAFMLSLLTVLSPITAFAQNSSASGNKTTIIVVVIICVLVGMSAGIFTGITVYKKRK